MCRFLLLATALTLSLPTVGAAAELDDEDLLQEIREARKELREASRKLGRLTELDLPDLGELARSLSFSMSGKRPMVGIVMAGSERNSGGVMLAGITPDAPADKAGLQSGDLLTRIDSHDLSGGNGLAIANDLLSDLEVADAFEFTYEREGESYTTTVIVEEHEPSRAFAFSGNWNWLDFDQQAFNFNFEFNDEMMDFDPQQFRDLADRYRNWSFDASKMPGLEGWNNLPYRWFQGWAWSGLELTQVNTKLGRYFGVDSGALVLEAANLGDSDLQSGDVIIAIEGEPVSDPQQTMRLLGGFEPGEQITVQIMRDRKQQEVLLIAPEAGDSSFSFSWSSDDD